jgi:hypothetical protein
MRRPVDALARTRFARVTTITDIANAALRHLKRQQVIIDISLNGATENVLRAAYPTVRDAVLRSHPWNSARQQFSLPAMAVVPKFGFANQYKLPADPWCLRVLSLNESDGSESSYDWIVSGRMLQTDMPAPATGWYIARIGEDLMDALLADCIAAKLAHDCCGALGNSSARKEEIAKAYRDMMPDARSVNAMESGPDEEEISSIEGARA